MIVYHIQGTVNCQKINYKEAINRPQTILWLTIKEVNSLPPLDNYTLFYKKVLYKKVRLRLDQN